MGPPPKTEAEMRTAICIAAAALDQNKVNAAACNLVKRREKCLKAGGLRFEYKLELRSFFFAPFTYLELPLNK